MFPHVEEVVEGYAIADDEDKRESPDPWVPADSEGSEDFEQPPPAQNLKAQTCITAKETGSWWLYKYHARLLLHHRLLVILLHLIR